MKKFLQIALLLSLTLASLVFAGSDSAEMINQAVTAFMKKNNVPGVAVTVFNDGEPSTYYYGYANQEKKIPISGETIFELGSISKVMTSLLLAQEVDFANLQLNTSLKEVIKDLPQPFEKVSLLSLATHISGLPFSPPEGIHDRDALGKYLQDSLKLAGPEKRWTYSNFGIGLLGYALETATQKDFDRLYISHIAKPLGMQNISALPKRKQAYIAQGYDDEGKPAQPNNPGLFPAAAGVKASSQDMQRFLAAAIGLPKTPARIFYPMRMTQSIYVKLPNRLQGLGWDINPISKHNIDNLLNDSGNPVKLGVLPVVSVESRPVFDPNALIDKTGATPGFRNYIAVIPNKKSGIVILTNKHAADGEIVKLGRGILFKMTKLSS